MFLHKTMALKTIINLMYIKIEMTLTIKQFFHPGGKTEDRTVGKRGTRAVSQLVHPELGVASEDTGRNRSRKGSV